MRNPASDIRGLDIQALGVLAELVEDRLLDPVCDGALLGELQREAEGRHGEVADGPHQPRRGADEAAIPARCVVDARRLQQHRDGHLRRDLQDHFPDGAAEHELIWSCGQRSVRCDGEEVRLEPLGDVPVRVEHDGLVHPGAASLGLQRLPVVDPLHVFDRRVRPLGAERQDVNHGLDVGKRLGIDEDIEPPVGRSVLANGVLRKQQRHLEVAVAVARRRWALGGPEALERRAHFALHQRPHPLHADRPQHRGGVGSGWCHLPALRRSREHGDACVVEPLAMHFELEDAGPIDRPGGGVRAVVPAQQLVLGQLLNGLAVAKHDGDGFASNVNRCANG
mmetsp:Transcript_36701/g.104407  ORF Transcript_36701/g.104407 Transcript_36701/m.104407 type:complete len:337 (-) Transcript_36701:303-1313(-)